MKESEDRYIDIDVLLQRRRKTEKKREENIRRRRISFFMEEKKNREGKGGKYLDKIPSNTVKDIEKSQSRDFYQFLEGFGIGFGEFSLGQKVSVLVSENSVSENKSWFGKIWYRKQVSVSVSVKILVSSFSVLYCAV